MDLLVAASLGLVALVIGRFLRAVWRIWVIQDAVADFERNFPGQCFVCSHDRMVLRETGQALQTPHDRCPEHRAGTSLARK